MQFIYIPYRAIFRFHKANIDSAICPTGNYIIFNNVEKLNIVAHIIYHININTADQFGKT
jgi:hypothetical protein